MLARALMSSPVITMPLRATSGEAARLMLANNASCLPVVDDQDHLVGIITRHDFLKLFAAC